MSVVSLSLQLAGIRAEALSPAPCAAALHCLDFQVWTPSLLGLHDLVLVGHVGLQLQQIANQNISAG